MKLLIAAVVVLPIAQTALIFSQGQGQVQNRGQGQGKGQGKPINYLHCNLSGDSELHTFTGQMGTVPLPCFYKMASLHLDLGVPGYPTFSLNVSAASDIEPYSGRYYIDRFKIQVMAHTTTGNSSSAVFRTDGDRVMEYRKDPAAAKNVWIREISSYFPSHLVLTDVFNRTGARLQLLKKNSPPVEIKFIPVDRTVGPFRQPVTPGLFLKVDKAIVEVNDSPKFPNTMCSTPSDDRTFNETKWGPPYNGTLENNRQLMLYTALQHIANQNHTHCDKVLDAFNNCLSDKDKMLAVRACAYIMEVGPVKCLGNETLEAFSLCIYSNCVASAEGADYARNLFEGILSGCPE